MQLRTQVDEAKQIAKEHYYARLSNQLMNPTTSAKHFWRITKELYGAKIKCGIPPLIKDGIVFATAKAKCRLFSEHFSKKAQLPNDLPKLPALTLETLDTLEYISVSEQEVLKVLKNLDISKASGPDGISNTLLKRAAHSICRPLCNLFNKSLHESISL